MPRAARRKSESNIYHVILRSINKQQLFEDDEDRDKLLSVLRECKELSGFELYAYCLMSNHIHFLLKTGKEELETVFRRIGARFVYWYNTKYGRVGHLFQDRYKSEAVEDDAYFLTALRYIHQNPVKAGLCVSPEEYQYSSYPHFFEDKLIDSAFVLTLMSKEEFAAFNLAANEDACMEISENLKKRMTDEQAKQLIFAIYPPGQQNDRGKRWHCKEIQQLGGTQGTVPCVLHVFQIFDYSSYYAGQSLEVAP